MQKLGLLVIVALMLLTGLVVLGQDTSLEGYTECDLMGLSAAIVASIETASDDETKLDTVLGEAASAISRVRAACAELSFAGNNAKLIGPIELEPGYYRVRVTTDAFFIAEVEVMSGTCDDGLLFALSRGEATEGAEALFDSEGCTILVDTDNVSAPWSLVFERLN